MYIFFFNLNYDQGVNYNLSTRHLRVDFESDGQKYKSTRHFDG